MAVANSVVLAIVFDPLLPLLFQAAVFFFFVGTFISIMPQVFKRLMAANH